MISNKLFFRRAIQCSQNFYNIQTFRTFATGPNGIGKDGLPLGNHVIDNKRMDEYK